MAVCPVPFEARASSSDPPAPIATFASEIAALRVRVHFDQDVTVIPGTIAPWTVVVDGFRRAVTSISQSTASSCELFAAAFGFADPARVVDYAPPPDSVTGLTGVPVAPFVNLPILP